MVRGRATLGARARRGTAPGQWPDECDGAGRNEGGPRGRRCSVRPGQRLSPGSESRWCGSVVVRPDCASDSSVSSMQHAIRVSGVPAIQHTRPLPALARMDVNAAKRRISSPRPQVLERCHHVKSASGHCCFSSARASKTRATAPGLPRVLIDETRKNARPGATSGTSIGLGEGRLRTSRW